MAIEIVEPTNTPNEGRIIWNDNFIDLDGRINEVELGIDAFSTTSASFVQPAVSSTVSVTVDETGWMAVGQPVYMTTGGVYTVSSVTDTTHVVLTNLGYSGNASVGATVASGKKVSPGGLTGADGTALPDATETVKGKAELATQAETDAGTDDTRIVTPLKLASYSGLGTGGGSGGFAPVLVATTGNITLSGTQTIDDIGVVAGDRVLVWLQSDDTQNGIYVVAAGAWSRAADANTSAQFTDGREVFIRPAGTKYSKYIAIAGPFVGGFTLGTDTVTFVMATPVASEATYGMAITATQSQVNAGDAGADLMVTPETLAAWRSVTLGSDVVNATTSFADVTGLSFAVVSGDIYRFKFVIAYSVNATTTGTQWAINGPTATLLAYTSEWWTAQTIVTKRSSNAYNSVGGVGADTPFTSGNLAIIQGIIMPSANGTVIARFASEVAVASAVTAKAGSTLEHRINV